MNKPQLTLQDFRNCDWQEALAHAANRECVAYAECFRASKEKAGAANNDPAQRAFELMERVCSFGFESSNINDSFPPMMTMGAARTVTPDDVHENELDVLGQVAPEIEDADLRARVADLIWLRKRDYRCAELAITSYLESASILEAGPVWLRPSPAASALNTYRLLPSGMILISRSFPLITPSYLNQPNTVALKPH